ncbi:hypothetical protein BJY21_002826 [Kineosphaera limosa]|uniref:DUF4244 domain-containing protein n=1 Tax=Kineosphaera limosa NBRC 100340 TaxID=1184609 RepID=K6WWN4_9MICO|nr:DUF4244 domain-containing protein [Kineosphaera limosa]NYE01642.1 hypothetical protein [Kineosphaera limosa]GAB98241.1 hypothetical protein KILIM_116_00050 [Kineosphaera limosa NBRC 100340]
MSLQLVRLYHSSPAHALAHRLRQSNDSGMSTAEYAIGTLAAVALAGVLLTMLGSDAIKTLLNTVFQKALTPPKP